MHANVSRTGVAEGNQEVAHAAILSTALLMVVNMSMVVSTPI
jgi:hypothetical protein